MRYIRLIGTFMRTALLDDWAQRSDFLFRLLSTALGLAGSLGGFSILFANRSSFNGWDATLTLMVLGVYMLVQAIVSLFVQPSLDVLAGMGGEIETGRFDQTLLKPVSKQFYVSVRKWSLWALVDMAIGGALLARACVELETTTTAAAWLFAPALLAALCIVYSLLLLLASAAFWYRGTYLTWLFGDVMQLARYPMGIYPYGVRMLFTWVVPIGFVATVPAQALAGMASPWSVGVGVLVAAGLFVVASWVFAMSLRRYASASS